MSVWFLGNRKRLFKWAYNILDLECGTFLVLSFNLLMDFIGLEQMVNMCCKTWFSGHFLCGFPGNAYFCTVFFIVLDLRLTKVGVQRNSFFYVRMWGFLFSVCWGVFLFVRFSVRFASSRFFCLSCKQLLVFPCKLPVCFSSTPFFPLQACRIEEMSVR